MSSDVSRRSAIGGKKMRKRKELDALTGTIIGTNNRNRRLMCSSESDSCSSSRAPTPIKLRRQITRRRKHRFISNTWCSALRMSLMFGCVVWVVFETYTFFDIRKIQLHLQTQLDEVAAGNQGVPDDLQKCHAMSKQLQINQTDIYQQLSGFNLQITNLTLQVKQLHTSLLSIEKRIPPHVPSPDVRKDLSAEVAKFGSELEDLNINVRALKENTASLQSNQKKLDSNITQIIGNLTLIRGSKTDETSINRMSDELRVQINDLSSNITAANQTLSSKLVWLSQDQKKDKDEIEKLKENSQKFLAQLKTIESKYQISEDELTKKFTDTKLEVSNLKNQIDKIASNVTSLHAQSVPDNSIVKSPSQLPESNSTTQHKP
ncbi:myosin-4-like isoform X1 [Adelges cooleyi]|uniref:myosin-4-like isoform X1 n=1 Tax=Adelges cooleyi TaxID=133065 RepID=UPI00217F4ACB|nr:myosin-4-like isoform X1 [Adelges cooleyi]